MRLHFKHQQPQEGFRLIVSPKNSPLKWQTFGLLRLGEAGRRYEDNVEDTEAILTLLGGKALIQVEESSGKSTGFQLGPRRDPFEERATMVYVPPGARYRVTSETANFIAAIHTAPAIEKGTPFLIEPDTLEQVSTGAGNWRRDVCVCTPPDVPVQRFIIGETINPPGNWSSYPPHKHDEDIPPYEAPYEEVYYFLTKPPQGFGVIRIYDPMGRENAMDEAYVIQNGDTFVLPRGYHPVAAAPGYQLYYLFSLVGETREYAAWSDDPDHAWIRNVEVMLRNRI